MAELSVEDVLREMDEASRYANADIEGGKLRRWLEVLRPALALRREVNWGGASGMSSPSTETLPLTSSLPMSQLRDLHLHVMLDTDHEGGGTLQIEYAQVPPQDRLQALIQIMGALGNRIELAVGRDSFINMLRGRADRLERGR